MSQIKVNSIVPSGGLPSGASGGIIQMVQDKKTGKFATTSTSYTDITGLSVEITPQSSSNKILVFTNVRFGSGASGSDNKYQILRGSTVISTDNYCRLNASSCTWFFSDVLLDEPSTTSTLTYKLQCKAETNEIFVNRNGSSHDHGASYITVMEVGM